MKDSRVSRGSARSNPPRPWRWERARASSGARGTRSSPRGGEPDFDTPGRRAGSGVQAIRAGHTRYTAVAGSRSCAPRSRRA